MNRCCENVPGKVSRGDVCPESPRDRRDPASPWPLHCGRRGRTEYRSEDRRSSKYCSFPFCGVQQAHPREAIGGVWRHWVDCRQDQQPVPSPSSLTAKGTAGFVTGRAHSDCGNDARQGPESCRKRLSRSFRDYITIYRYSQSTTLSDCMERCGFEGENNHDRSEKYLPTSRSNDPWIPCPCALGFDLLAVSHGLCRAQFISICLYKLVPRNEHLPLAWATR